MQIKFSRQSRDMQTKFTELCRPSSLSYADQVYWVMQTKYMYAELYRPTFLYTRILSYTG